MKKRINPLVFDLSINSKLVDKFAIARKEVERIIQSNKINWNEKNLLKEIDRLKVKLNNKTTYTKSIEKKAYNLSLSNEFLKNKIATIGYNTGFEFSKIKSLTKEEQIELLEKVRAFKASAVSFIDNSKNNKKKEKKEVELVRGKWYAYSDGYFRYRNTIRDKVYCLSFICPRGFDMDDNPYYFQKTENITLATKEQIAKGVVIEEENGKFWNDEKQDYLKLEDVYFKAETRQELLEIANIAGVEILANNFDIDITYPFVQMSDDSFMYNSLTDRDNVEATKEVFIKLLKNYKG